jgi:hypothetical protein
MSGALKMSGLCQRPQPSIVTGQAAGLLRPWAVLIRGDATTVAAPPLMREKAITRLGAARAGTLMEEYFASVVSSSRSQSSQASRRSRP